MGFAVHPTAYFLVCNADRSKEDFNKAMHFEEALVPYQWDSSWIGSEVDRMIALMNQREIPAPNESCKNCAYAEQYSQALHPQGNNQVIKEQFIQDKLWKEEREEEEFINPIPDKQSEPSELLQRIREELKEEHKHDEYIESYRNDDEWDFLDWLKFMWDSAPTDRRKYLRKNPDYIGPKKKD